MQEPPPAPLVQAFLSSAVNLNIKLLVQNLHGSMPEMESRGLGYTECLSERTGCTAADLYLEFQLFVHGQPLGLPERTCNMPGSRLRWNEWITFRAKYCDLSADAWIDIKLCGSDAPRAVHTLASAKLALFNEGRQLRMGNVKLLFKLNGQASSDGSAGGGRAGSVPTGSTTIVPSSSSSSSASASETAADEQEIARLEELAARHEAATQQPDAALDWLNRPTYAYLEQRQQEISRRLERHIASIQLPELEYPVLFHETVEALPFQPQLKPSAATTRAAAGGAAGGSGGKAARSGNTSSTRLGGTPGAPPDAPIVLLSDYEQLRDNPALHKHHKLARSLLSAGFAKELKPDSDERRRLQELVQKPPTYLLREEERELLWKFRYSLTKEKRALTKLLKCVDWGDAREVQQAYTLVHTEWVAVEQVQDLLELLSFAFVDAAPWVREFAVAALRERATDAQLLLYLLPLVQALQYERNLQPRPPAECPLAALLIQRALGSVELANFLHWYLKVERQDDRHGAHFAHVHDTFLQQLHAVASNLSVALRQQESFVDRLNHSSQSLKATSDSRPKKIARLQAMFDQVEFLGPLRRLQTPLLMPLDPRRLIVSGAPEKAHVFKSKLQPIRLSFETAAVIAHDPGAATKTYTVIFKCGDDLRQDQLVLQMLMLIDKLLQDEGLDLKLTPYRALATGQGQGLVECVADCQPISQILNEHKDDIRRYLQLEHPSPDAPYGIEPEVLETFVKSCAGYCVAMYLLGVGDRHMDNLMLCSNGKLFHIDFGFILGNDPKPLPPKVRLIKQMVEAMGGEGSAHYAKFQQICCEAFNILRRPSASNLILNLLLLMVDAGVEHLTSAKDVAFVTERLQLGLSNEEASRYFQETLHTSVSALFPQLIEKLHSFAQWTRA